jgi:LacI family transcriptional regulator
MKQLTAFKALPAQHRPAAAGSWSISGKTGVTVVTIKDVAEAAGVSTATVSRVFNETAHVDEDTSRRVSVAARRLNYWPNGSARSLTTSRSHAIGVLLPDLFGEFFSEIIRGIDHAARNERFQILVSSSHADVGELVSAVRSMHGRIDGLIAMALDGDSADLIRRVCSSFPVVLLNTGFRVKGCSTLSIANLEGAGAMGRHLVQLGHRTIAMIKGPSGNADAEERLKGFRQALTGAGVDLPASLQIAGDFTESSGYHAAAAILAHRPRPTAVFTANDYMAIGLLGALRQAGVRVPEELAVAGFDDIAIAQYLSPPLTTVHVDAYEEGQRAVGLLLSALKSTGPVRATREVLPARLVIRGSCGSRAPFAAGVDRRRVSRTTSGATGARPRTAWPGTTGGSRAGAMIPRPKQAKQKVRP